MSENAPPKFTKRRYDKVHQLVAGVLRHGEEGGANYLHSLKMQPDKHYRVIFSGDYFDLSNNHPQPTKSQWNNLKKRFKRRDRRLFIFREYGQIKCPNQTPSGLCYYIDIGFFAE